MTTSTTGRPPAVVTGASSGIGLEPATVVAEHGYDLVIAAEAAGSQTAGPHWQTHRTRVERVRGGSRDPRGRRGQPGPFEAVYAASKAFVGSLPAALDAFRLRVGLQA